MSESWSKCSSARIAFDAQSGQSMPISGHSTLYVPPACSTTVVSRISPSKISGFSTGFSEGFFACFLSFFAGFFAGGDGISSSSDKKDSLLSSSAMT